MPTSTLSGEAKRPQVADAVIEASRGHGEIGDQALRSMPDVFILGALDHAWLQRQGRSSTLQGLDARLLIGAHDMPPLLGEGWRLLIDLTHCRHLVDKRLGIIGLRVEPVLHSMGFQSGLILKNARHFGY